MTSSEPGWFSSSGVERLRQLSRVCLDPWSLLCLVGLAWAINQLVRPTPERPPPIAPRLYPCEEIASDVYTVAWSPDGQSLAVVSHAGEVALWDAAFERERPYVLPVDLAKRAGGEWHARDLAWSPDGRTLASTLGHEVLLWDAAAGVVRRVLAGHAKPVRSLAFAPDGRTLLSGDIQGIVRSWDLETGGSRELAASIHRGDTRVGAAWFSTDARTIAATVSDGAVVLRDADSGAIRQTLLRPNELVLSAAFSPDGRSIAVGGTGARVDVFDVATGRAKGSWSLPSPNATALAFTPDGRGLAVASGPDGTVMLCDVASRRERLTLKGIGPIRGLSFTQDGQSLAGGSAPAKVAIWTLPTGP
jgi:WD40 repeat protein